MDNRIKEFNMSLEVDLNNKFGNDLSKKVKLSNYSWFNLGGYAEYFYKAKDKEQLKTFLNTQKIIILKLLVLVLDQTL